MQFTIQYTENLKSGGCFKDNTPDFLLFWTNLSACGPDSYVNNYLSLQ